MPAKTTKQPHTEIDEARIVAWLADSPDFFFRHPESLSAMELPVDSGAAISLHQYQVRVLRDEKIQLTEKLGVLVKNVKTNHKIHSDLLSLAANMIALARDGAEADAFLLLIKQHFALLDVKLVEKKVSAKAFKQLNSMLGKADSVCENELDEALIESLFEDSAPDVLSMAVVPVKSSRKYSACLVLAADDKERFRPGMGGEFLKQLAQLLSSFVGDA